MSGEDCLRALEELEEAIKELEKYKINPKKAGKWIRNLAEVGKLTPDIFRAYLRFRRAEFELFRCLRR